MINRYKYYILALLLFILVSNPIFCQTFKVSYIDGSKFPKIKASFLATDMYGKSFNDLTPSDFDVKENDVSVNSSVGVSCQDSTEVVPLRIVLVLDQSSSMELLTVNGNTRWSWVVSGVTSFLNHVNFTNGTKVSVVSFGSFSYIRSPFSENPNAILDSISKIHVGGGTKYDPPFTNIPNGAIEMLRNEPEKYRRIIVFLTDGEPSVPTNTDFIIKEAIDANVQIYSITLSMNINNELELISRMTSGKSFSAFYETDLSMIYQFIAMDLEKKQLCELSWNAPFGCNNEHFRKVDINFKRNNTNVTKTYSAPDTSIANLQFSENLLFFDDPMPGDTTYKDITITAINSDYYCTDLSFAPSTYFSVAKWDVYGNGTAPPFTLKVNQSRTIRVRFVQQVAKTYRSSVLKFNGLPCSYFLSMIGGLNKIKLLSPVGGESYSSCDSVLIKWSGVDTNKLVTIIYSTDNGVSWKNLVGSLKGNSYKWKPTTESSQYKIKVIEYTKPENIWSNLSGGNSADVIVFQPDGMYGYVAGTFYTKFKNRLTVGSRDVYIIKFDSDGNEIWSTTFGSSGADSIGGLFIDPKTNNLYVVGVSYGFTNIGNMMLKGGLGYAPDCFIAKFTQGGQCISAGSICGDYTFRTFQCWGQRIAVWNNSVYIDGLYRNFNKFNGFQFDYPVKENAKYVFGAKFGMDLSLNSIYLFKNDLNVEYSSNSCKDYLNNSYQANSNGSYRKYGGIPSSQDSSSAFSVTSPKISFKSKECNFGSITVTDSKSINLKEELCNIGLNLSLIVRTEITGNDSANFSLTSGLKSIILSPNECKDIELTFNPQSVGYKEAILKVYGACNEYIEMNLNGYSICNGKSASSFTFNQALVGTKNIELIKCAYKNTNDAPIEVEPILKGINISDFSISPNGKIIIQPDNCLDITVTYSSNSIGESYAYIHYNLPFGCDNLNTELFAESVSGSFNISGWSFGEHRILTESFANVVFRNTSSIPVKITQIFLDDPVQKQIIINQNYNFPIIIKANDSLLIPIKFIPKQELDYMNVVNVIIESFGDTIKAKVAGTGILPKIESELNCIGKTHQNQKSILNLKISNTSSSSILKVKDIKINNPNYNLFFEDISAKNFILNKNTDTIINLIYSPITTGLNQNDVIITSDALSGPEIDPRVDTTLHIDCESMNVNNTKSLEYGPIMICDNESQSAFVYNLSWQEPIRITQTFFEKNNPDSALFNFSIPNSDIKAGDSLKISILFEPKVTGKFQTSLYCVISTGDTIRIKLSGSAEVITVYSEQTDIKIDLLNKQKIIIYGNISELKNKYINELKILFKYDSTMISYVKNSVNNEINPNFEWTWNEPIGLKDGILSFNGLGKLPTAFKGSLISFFVDGYLADKSYSFTNIQHIIDGCKTNDTIGSKISITGICFLNGRMIVIGDSHFYLEIPSPNPTNKNVLIKFGVPLKSETKLELFNSLGEKIEEIYHKFSESGEYEIIHQLTDYPSGVYFIKYSSAGNYSFQKFVKE
jgi:hypothetical protein